MLSVKRRVVRAVLICLSAISAALTPVRVVSQSVPVERNRLRVARRRCRF
jgi:hypothetical protein